MPHLVEGVVDDDPPHASVRPEVVIGQPTTVADVAEHDVDRPTRATPDEVVAMCALHVGSAEVNAQAVGHHGPDQFTPPTVVVLAFRPLDDRLVVDITQLHPDSRVDAAAVEVNLWDVPSPV